MAQQPTSWLDHTTANIDATAFTGHQQIVGLSNGNILVVFSDNTAQSPGAGRDIAGVIYDAEGNVVRSQFQVNVNYIADEEQRPSIAATNDGGFVIVYQDDDENGTSIRAERHDANGDTVDVTTVILDPGTIDLANPKVAVDLSDNSFFVTYEHDDSNDNTIRGRKFDADMNQVGGEQVLRTDDDPTNTIAGGDPLRHDTAVLTNGSFVTVFDEDDVTDGLVDQGIEFRLSTAAGANGTLKNVTGQNGIQETDAKVAALADGGFVVVWAEPEDPGIDQNNNIRAKIYDADGTARTGSFIIAADPTDNYGEPDVIGLDDGTFFVAWQDQTNERLLGRLLTPGGASIGSVIEIETASNPHTINLGATTDGRILITYQTVSVAGSVHYEILDPRSGVITAAEDDGQVTARLEGSTIIGSVAGETLLGQAGDDIFQYVQGVTNSSNVDAIFGGGGVNTFEITNLLSERIIDLTAGIFALGDIDAAGAVRGTLEDVQNVTVVGAQDIRGSAAANILTATGDHQNDVQGMDGDDTIYGGGGGDRLEGGDGNDSIDGGTGNDTMNGGDGDDAFIVASKNDVVTESTAGAAGGDDTVFSGASSFTLGANIEDLTLTGANNSTAIGNALANRLTGNDGNNSLQGSDGDDTLSGSDGDDDLRAGTGADRMNGGNGNDRHFVDDAADLTIENNADLATGGIDTVFSTVNRTLADNIENLRLQGSADLNGNGNELANKIWGTDGINVLQGLAGADTITAKNGNDTIDGGEGNDTISGGGGLDVYRFTTANAGVDTITDFSQVFDRFDLSGGAFTAVSIAPNGDAVLTHTGGAIRIQNPPNLTLNQWNALVVSAGAGASEESPALAARDMPIDPAGSQTTHWEPAQHGDWAFA